MNSQRFKGTVVNRVFSSLQWVSFTLTVPLRNEGEVKNRGIGALHILLWYILAA